MSAPRFDAADWLTRWKLAGNVAFASIEPKPGYTLHFDGDNVDELLTELRAANGESQLFATLCKAGAIRNFGEAAHG